MHATIMTITVVVVVLVARWRQKFYRKLCRDSCCIVGIRNKWKADRYNRIAIVFTFEIIEYLEAARYSNIGTIIFSNIGTIFSTVLL